VKISLKGEVSDHKGNFDENEQQSYIPDVFSPASTSRSSEQQAQITAWEVRSRAALKKQNKGNPCAPEAYVHDAACPL
jgi:hypothetical protein